MDRGFDDFKILNRLALVFGDLSRSFAFTKACQDAYSTPTKTAMLSYFFLYNVKPRPPFLAPFKDTSTQIEGGKEYVNSSKCSTFPIEWIPIKLQG